MGFCLSWTVEYNLIENYILKAVQTTDMFITFKMSKCCALLSIIRKGPDKITSLTPPPNSGQRLSNLGYKISKQEKIKGLLVGVDARKAFDSVDHEYPGSV